MAYMRNTNVVPNDVANQTITETAPVQAQTTVHKPLSEHVFTSVSTFLNNPANADTTDLYEIVMNEVERPLLNRVMQYTHGNQSKAAKVMGINRSTLRRMLKKHGLYF